MFFVLIESLAFTHSQCGLTFDVNLISPQQAHTGANGEWATGYLEPRYMYHVPGAGRAYLRSRYPDRYTLAHW